MKILDFENFPQFREQHPERIIQFGEGNFLRGFVDWMIHRINQKGLFNGSIVAIQPTPHGKVVPKLNKQNGLYTMVLRGIQDDQVIDQVEVITSISRGINPYENWEEVLQVAENPEIQFAFSNTTEAGLVYSKEDYDSSRSPLSYPGKLTAFLYHRYQTFGHSIEAALTMIPCELVENNGDLLKQIVIQLAKDWNFGDDFIEWIEKHNRFCNTLVDRIVTGFPKDQMEQYAERLGYDDQLITVGEPYHLFAIEADESVSSLLPFDQAGLNVHWVDVRPYRELKVRLLNGAHTLMVPVGYLFGKNFVQEVMEDETLRSFIIRGMYQEIFPFVSLNVSQKKSFADSVVERFLNPFNKHFLLDISLNSIYKFKTRLLPTLLDYVADQKCVPATISFSLAALIRFYQGIRWEGNHLVGTRDGEEYPIRDQMETLQFLNDIEQKSRSIEETIEIILKNKDLWELDLTEIDGLREKVTHYFRIITEKGMKNALLDFIQEKE
ncbi:MAG TPA: tagaturonate reductase [Bacillota bacterium]|nr:tagaturonate reductase [Bacillota bacterium]